MLRPRRKSLFDAPGKPSYQTPGIGDGINDVLLSSDALPSVAQSRAAAADDGSLWASKLLMAEQNPALPEIKKPNGIFDRIGDFIGSDEGKAALLRSGAATINGGLGAGIEAGANFMDQRKGLLAAREQALAELGLKREGVEIDRQRADAQGRYYETQGEIGLAREGNNATANDIAAWKSRAEAALRAKGIEVDWARIAQDDTNNVRNNSTSRANNQDNNSTARRGQDATNWRHTTPSASSGGANSGPNFSYQVPGAPASSKGGFFGMGATPVPAVPKVNVSGKSPPPSPESIEMLKKDPSLAGQFDAQFGRGTAALYLRR